MSDATQDADKYERLTEIIKEIWEMQNVTDPLADLAQNFHARCRGLPGPQYSEALNDRLVTIAEQAETIDKLYLTAWLRYASKYKAAPGWGILLDRTREVLTARGETPEKIQTLLRGLHKD